MKNEKTILTVAIALVSMFGANAQNYNGTTSLYGHNLESSYPKGGNVKPYGNRLVGQI